MAAKRFLRYLAVAWDRDAARRLQQEAEAALAKTGAAAGEEFEQAMATGGRKAARALTTTLEREYRIRIGRSRQQLAEGLIDERAFEREGRDAAEAFNKGLTGGIRRIKGTLSDLELANLTGRFKRVPSEGGGRGMLAGLAGRALGIGAGVFTAGAAIREAGEWIDAADRYDAALRKLDGTARVTGISIEQLRGFVAGLRAQTKLSEPVAVDLTATMAKMAMRAGDVEQTGSAMIAWLDLAAANGLDAQTALEALNTTLIGQDEGLNKLGLANPQQLYEKWAVAAGVSAAKMTDAQKAQAILNAVTEAGAKVQGAYGDYLKGNAGLSDQQRQRIDELQASAGRAIRPFSLLALELKTGLYEVLGDLARRFTETQKAGEGFWSHWFGYRPLSGDPRAALSEDLMSHEGAAVMAPAQQAAAAARARAAAAAEAAAKAAEEAKKAKAEAEKKRLERERLAKERIERLWKGLDEYKGFDRSDSLVGVSPALQAQEARRRKFRENLDKAPEDRDKTLPVGAIPPDRDLEKRLGSERETWFDHYEKVQSAAQAAAYEISSAFQDAFQLMMEEGATLGNFLEGVGRGIAGALLSGLAQFAQGKVKENIAAAIEAAAYALGFSSFGNFASAGAAWSSAAEHSAAALAWGVLAGGAGAGRGAVTGGRGGIPNPVHDAGLSTFEGAEKRGAEVHIYIDPLNPRDPAWQRSVYAGYEYAKERFGEDANVIVHPRSRG